MRSKAEFRASPPPRRRRGLAGMWALLGGSCLLGLAGAGWVDPDTPVAYQTTRSLKDGRPYYLVMSDEFEIENRTFRDGADPVWTAIDHSDDSRTSVGEGSLMFYNHTQVTTKGGYLHINTSSETTEWKGFNPYKRKYDIFHKDFKGGMIQSWNKFCFSGGVVEISVRLPGQWDVGGLWPAFWLMGNLGRAVYEHSTNMMWPWSFNECDRSLQLAQEISKCGRTRHWDFHAHQGRGATEIDILEVMPGKAPPTDLGVGLPYVSTTLQISPGVRENRPVPGKDLKEHPANWYPDLKFGPMTKQNQYFFGTLLDKTNKDEPAGRSIHQIYQADALSALTPINADHFKNFHKFRLEWMPGEDGYLAWYLDNVLLYEVDASSLAITGAQIPVEPSYLILNTAVSTTWGFPQTCPEGCTCQCFDCSRPECRCALPVGFCDSLPATMLVDYVRVYQLRNDSRHFVGCDHPTHPTKKFIKAHEWRYIRDHEVTPLLYVPKGFGKCKTDDDCKPGGTCDPRRKWCKCGEGWWGPDCKSRPYHDDDEPPKHIRLPVRWLDPPVSLQILAAIFLVTFTSALLTIAKNRRRLESERQQDEAEAERRRSTSIQAASARPPMPTSGGLHRSVRSLT